jgi:hypothetical protein
MGHQAVGFKLPEGTEIYAPYDGAFLEDEFADSEEDVSLREFSRARIGIPDTSSFVVFTVIHNPAVRDGEGVTAGQAVASVSAPLDPIHEASGSNFVVYTDNYDLSSLFVK